MAVVLALAEIFTVVMERNVCEKVFDKKHTGILAQFLGGCKKSCVYEL